MRLPITQLLMADGVVHSLHRNRICLEALADLEAFAPQASTVASLIPRFSDDAGRLEPDVLSTRDLRTKSPAQAVDPIRSCSARTAQIPKLTVRQIQFSTVSFAVWRLSRS
jgi:hypothetical protein